MKEKKVKACEFLFMYGGDGLIVFLFWHVAQTVRSCDLLLPRCLELFRSSMLMQWTDASASNKCSLCPLETLWCFKVYKKLVSREPSHSLVWPCRLDSDDSISICRSWTHLVMFWLVTRFFAELYQQMLAKALAHFFDAKLLLLDVNDFALKVP